MLLHYDISTPRPYSRMQTICGTLGFLQKYPVPSIQIETKNGTVTMTGDEAVAYVESFIPQEFKDIIENGKRLGVGNVMNYTMDYRIVESIEKLRLHQDNTSLDMDVYDAAEWSSLVELTEQSALAGGAPIEIPDFTRGEWNKTEGFEFAFAKYNFTT